MNHEQSTTQYTKYKFRLLNFGPFHGTGSAHRGRSDQKRTPTGFYLVFLTPVHCLLRKSHRPNGRQELKQHDGATDCEANMENKAEVGNERSHIPDEEASYKDS